MSAQSEEPVLRRPRRPRRSTASKVVGVAGEVLITGGVLVLLFLGWQFTLNGVMLSNQQASDADSLVESWSASTPAPASDDGTGAPDTAVSAAFAYGQPPVSSTPAPDSAEEFAVMYVPRFGADYRKTIAEGVDPKSVLNKGGAGHYSTTQMPGEVGNFAVAAHRDGWGSPFLKINELTVGDAIYVETQDGWYTYTFRGLEYVSPYGVGVIDPVPQMEGVTATDRIITLTSCNPLYVASERIIAYGVLTDWTPRSAGAPAAIASLTGA
ncbi:class E sortase [Herbiconiux moechotypicola]|uniref:Class E sortase n=1 Tax=Herbiconiux moechotypicola TaxID=637393 RepID=A0ABN3DB60_9MICO|nr:class E sortase [Herbiconiux moechotypicola]MCS5728884.1 class E sortase [Herbiconiux moechotypicola]